MKLQLLTQSVEGPSQVKPLDGVSGVWLWTLTVSLEAPHKVLDADLVFTSLVADVDLSDPPWPFLPDVQGFRSLSLCCLAHFEQDSPFLSTVQFWLRFLPHILCIFSWSGFIIYSHDLCSKCQKVCTTGISRLPCYRLSRSDTGESASSFHAVSIRLCLTPLFLLFKMSPTVQGCEFPKPLWFWPPDEVFPVTSSPTL